MKKICLLYLLTVCFLLSSCGGYTGELYGRLDTFDDYAEYSAVLREIYYLSAEYEKLYDFSSDSHLSSSVYIKVVFDEYEDIDRFLGTEADRGRPREDYPFVLEIIAPNAGLLDEGGFFSDAREGAELDIRASCCVYMDYGYYYVAGLCMDGEEYLATARGLENIVKHMDENRSLI